MGVRQPKAMTNGVISLDDIQSSGNDGGSTESDNSDAFAELREACEVIEADVDNAIERVKSSDGTDEESLIEMAESLAEDDELWDTLEEYRAMTDQHRLKQNFLLDADREFTAWSSAFYGDSDDPEEGTYNFIQQKSRDMGGNLYYYKALFPEPHMEHFPSEQAIVWMERPDDDAHIYVTSEYVDEYGAYTLEIEGQERPVPPWDGDAPDGASDDEDALDPREMTNDDVRDIVGDLSRDELESLLEVERATKDRKGAKSAIRDELDARDSDDEGDDDDDTITVTINGEEVTGSPEDIRALKGL